MMQYMEGLQRMQTLLCRQSLEGPLSSEEEQELASLRLLLSTGTPANKAEPAPEPTPAQLMEALDGLRERTDRLAQSQETLLRRLRVPSLQSNLLHFFRGFSAAILALPLLGAGGVGCLWLARWLAESLALPLPLTLGVLGCLILGGLLFACSGPMARVLFRWISEQDNEASDPEP